VGAAKVTTVVTRATGRGGGTALPGLVALHVDPHLVRKLASQLEDGSVVIAGTNGKTTTSQMLDSILRNAGKPPLRNRAGSNLLRGIASSLAGRAGVTGRVSSDAKLAVFEVDEAALPGVLREVNPRRLVLLNLFRDQLDRYGEVATVGRLWKDALGALDPDAQVIANADDPLIVDAVSGSAAPVMFFGVETTWAPAGAGPARATTPGSLPATETAEGEARSGTLPAAFPTALLEHASDVKACPRCGGAMRFEAVFLGHQGHYSCTQCDLRRPEPAISAHEVALEGLDGSRFTLHSAAGETEISVPLPGLYNAYNALTASAAALSLGLSAEQCATGIRETKAAFGRMERLQVEGRTVQVALAKNPTGLNEIVRTIAAGSEPLHLLVMLNDNTADGHDVSWIWDADIELLGDRLESVCFSGRRAADMALRFKYAELLEGTRPPRWSVIFDTEAAFRQALDWTPSGGRLFVIPTYTAMLDVRGVLTRLGHVQAYWEGV
jgi:UDP-N-acetylmuramyl tripeptide synthase